MGEILAKTAKKWQLVMYITFVAGACAFFVSTLIAPKYESEITILIVQGDANASSASQSVEYLSDVFAYVVHTELFFDDVMKSRLDIQDSFEGTPAEQRKQWVGEVDVEKNSSAGILKVIVENESRSQAHLIAQAIAENFATNSEKYHGSSDNVVAKLIDGPITSSKPTIPNIPLNIGFGLLIGLVGSLVIIIFYDSFDLKIVNRKTVVDSLVREQLEKQIKKREEKKELVYEQEEDEEFRKKAAFKQEQTIETQEQDMPSFSKAKEEKVKPDFEGSMIDAKEFEDQIKAETEQPKKAEESVKDQDQKNMSEMLPAEKVENDEPEKKNVLSKLYSKSLFADKKFKSLQAQRTSHEREVDNDQLPIVESVKKVQIPETETGEVLSKEKKAAAPENLPIFREDEKQEFKKRAENVKQNGIDKKTEVAVEKSEKEHDESKQEMLGLESNYKEFEPIEHVAGPDEESKRETRGETETREVDVETKRRDVATPFERVIELEQEDKQVEPVDKEPSEDEVKERLNKLLKGEL